MKNKSLGIFLCIVFILISVSVFAQQGDMKPSWGGDKTMVKSIHVSSFVPLHSDMHVSWTNVGGLQRYCDSGYACNFMETLDLPSGAKLIAVELDGCDNSAIEGLILYIYADGRGENSYDILLTELTGDGAADGCTCWYWNLSTPHTIDNYNNSYFVNVLVPEYTSNLTFGAVRLYYQLQISPAPVTATFSDVPVSSFWHQYVEALANSGITTGYGDGTFRPDNPVSRGQMAAFLARALGLYWPN